MFSPLLCLRIVFGNSIVSSICNGKELPCIEETKCTMGAPPQLDMAPKTVSKLLSVIFYIFYTSAVT